MDDDAGSRLEGFIQDWDWDTASHAFARQAGSFLFHFIADLERTGLAEQTLRKQISDCQLIGYFTCQYGGYKTFSPSVFAHGPAHVAEFRRKVSDSDYMVTSYERTWRKLARYIRSLGHEEEHGHAHHGSMRDKISVEALRGVSLLFADDVYELARFLLKMDMAKDKPDAKGRHTVHGVATAYAMIAQVDHEAIREVLEARGLPLGAVVERDEEVASKPRARTRTAGLPRRR